MQVHTVNKYLLILMMIFISSCRLSDAPTRIVDGDPEPPAPSGPKDAWINWTMVEGVDRDQDGVRDDVEIWINNNGRNEYIRKALKQRWKTDVEFIRLSEDESISKKELMAKFQQMIGLASRARECLSFASIEDINDKIGPKYSIFKESLRPVAIAEARYSERLAGMTGMAPGFYGIYIEGETYCDFEIPQEKVDQIKKFVKKTFFKTDYEERLEMETYYKSRSWRQP